ncbi:MAG: hypothetical protein QOI73_3392, partial [Solirubrobacteraceae bacterium]|nr:hypothetical protein [Solirubrobacteraceae bacterium]
RPAPKAPAPPAPPPAPVVAAAPPDGKLVNPEIFSVLERYKQADRGVAKKAFGRMFSTRPGAAAIAPSAAATPQQLQAAGTTIGLVSKIADVTAQIASMDASAEGATKAQQDAAANRARAAIWEQSGVPVDMRPLRSGVVGAEISANRAAFQEERVRARGVALDKADKANRGLVTKERAAKASLGEDVAGEAVNEPSALLKLLGDGVKELTEEHWIALAGGGVAAINAGVGATHSRAERGVEALDYSAGALGGALSYMTAIIQLKAAMKHGMASAELDAIGSSSTRDRDRARDIAIGGASEVAQFKTAIAAGKSVGSTISAIGGLLIASPAGPILKIVGTAVGAAVSVVDTTKDSYQAGKVVEKEFEAQYHGDAEESAEYVLRYGADHRAENLIRKARGGDAGALKALAVFGITQEALAKQADNAALRATIIKHQGVATKNIGTRVDDAVGGLGIGEYFSDSGGAMVQHYRADMAERTARAKDEMLYGEGVTGQRHNMTKVRAKAFFRTGPQVDAERRAQLEILKIKIAKRNHGLDPKTLELVLALLQPQAYYQQLKADAKRKVAIVKKFGPGTSIQHPGQVPAAPPLP